MYLVRFIKYCVVCHKSPLAKLAGVTDVTDWEKPYLRTKTTKNGIQYIVYAEHARAKGTGKYSAERFLLKPRKEISLGKVNKSTSNLRTLFTQQENISFSTIVKIAHKISRYYRSQCGERVSKLEVDDVHVEKKVEKAVLVNAAY